MISYRFLKNPDEKILDQLTALYAEQGWWDKSDSRAMLRRIVRDSHCFLAAFEGKRLAGMGRAVNALSKEAYIHDVAVFRAFRGRDIGSGLLRRLTARLKKDGIRWIGLIASGGSAPFYRAQGFSTPPRAAAMTKNV
ncbi:MAG: GNAT family N-acetyltransferase [Elusimicrobiales bacterium]|nr:GNAT family N-acetyltransferase [Elusimicrobiales bacterium]